MQHLLKSKAQAIAVYGDEGTGKFALASHMASLLLEADSLDNEANLMIVRPDEKGQISIDILREAIKFTTLKGGFDSSKPRVLIIEKADIITNESQNTLLKTLEEPPLDVCLILTVNSLSNLLPTINSRLKKLQVLSPAEPDIESYFSEYSKKELANALAISSGRIGLLSAILRGEESELMSSIGSVKQILAANSYKRLMLVDEITKNNPLGFIEALLLVSEASFKRALKKGDTTSLKKWHKIRRISRESSISLQNNANSKLTITNLIINI